MPISLQSSLIRIWSFDKQVIGVGFLVSKNHMLTCAHVISSALDQSPQAMPNTSVQIDFPLVAPQLMITAVVTIWNPKRPDGSGDIAGLELQQPAPDGAQPVRLVAAPETWNHQFRTFGFPLHHDDGVWATGVLRDRKTNGHIQIEDTKVPGIRIQPGFSGAPVWDEELEGIIGMVVTAEKRAETKLAFIVPTTLLIGTWPDLSIWAMPPNPYRGLKAFRQEDAGVFFGRERFVEDLETAVTNKPFVTVIGASGSGKSSVVFAGLLPTVGRETAVVQFRPGSLPFRALADALLPIWQPTLQGNERMEEARKLAKNLQDNKTQLLEVVYDILQEDTTRQRLLLVADQFEELYTLCPQPEIQRAFVRCLVNVVQSEFGQFTPHITLLLTMRADFMGRATEERSLANALQDATYILGPMTREELETAVEKPAQAAGVQFESRLGVRILDDVGDEPGNLPLLEFAMTLLWEQQKNGLLTHVSYEAIGGVEGALARYAEEQFASLNELEQAQARLIFTQLVQPGRGTEDTRRQATVMEIGAENWGLVKWLADARLVVTNRNEAGEETAEIVHEVLTRRWHRLREWMNEDRRFREWQERLRETMRQWGAAKEDEAALLRGTLLAEAEGWLTERSGQLPSKERTFVEKSIEFREHVRFTQIRRRNVVLAVSLLTTVLFAVLGLFSYGQSQDLAVEGTRAAANEGTAVANAELVNAESTRAFQNEGTAVAERAVAQAESTRADQNLATAIYNEQLATTREAEAVTQSHIVQSLALVTESRSVSGKDDMWALLSAVEGVNRAETSLAIEALNQQLPLMAKPLQAFVHNARINGVVLNNDGDQIMTWSEDGTIRVWEIIAGEPLGSNEPILVIHHGTSVRGATWNNAESYILSWACDTLRDVACVSSTARMWDAKTGQQIMTLSHDEDVQSDPRSDIVGAAWNVDEGRILTWSWAGTANVWDASTGRKLLTLQHERGIDGATWNKNENRIMTWSWDGTARVWDVNTGNLIQVLSHDSTVNGASWSEDENLILSWSYDNTARVWDVNTGKQLAFLPHESGVTGATWNKDETRILTWGEDGTAKVWDWDVNTMTSAQLFTFNHEGWVLGAVWNEANSKVLTWSNDSTVRMWDANTGEELLILHHPASVIGATWNEDESQIVAWSGSGTARIWDATTGEYLLSMSHEIGVSGSLWLEGEKRILTWGGDNTARLWDTNPSSRPLVVFEGSLFGGVWNENESQIIAWGCDKLDVFRCVHGSARVWLVNKREELLTLNHDGAVYGASWNSDETEILTWGWDGTARIWDARTGEILQTLNHSSPEDLVRGAKWNNSESQILTWSSKPRGNGEIVQIWEAASGQPLSTYTFDGRMVYGATWNTDENQILVWGCREHDTNSLCANGQIQVWDSNGRSMLILNHEGGMGAAMWNPNEDRILTWGNKVAKLWDATTGNLLFTLDNGCGIQTVVWNKDESRILTSGTHECVWDAANHKLLIQRQGSGNGGVWNEDESLMLTWGNDTAYVWNTTNGENVLQMRGGDTVISVAGWNKEENKIYLLSTGGVLYMFHSNVAELVHEACNYVTRNFTWSEWQLYFPGETYRPTCSLLPCDSTIPDAELELEACQK